MNNYIASKVKFEEIDPNTFRINNAIYTVNHDKDSQYIDDGVLNLSYYHLEKDGEQSQYILAFDKIEDVEPEDISEWSDEYDSNNPYILEFN